MEVLPIILMEAAATHTEAHRVCMDTMVAMDMDMAMARGLLKLSLDMVDMVVLLTYGGSSSVYRTTQGLTGYGYGGYGGYGHGYGKRSAEPGYGYGHATSYYHRSPQGLHGHYGGYGYGGYG